jgi:hypothetical protein
MFVLWALKLTNYNKKIAGHFQHDFSQLVCLTEIHLLLFQVCNSVC